MPLIRVFVTLFATGSTVIAVAQPQAQTATTKSSYPARAIRFLVGTAPGGSVDIVSRIVSGKFGEALGQPIVIENRSSAGGVAAADIVAHASPDGYTLLFAYSSHTAAPFLVAKLPYDTIKDFTPIMQIAKGPSVLVANPTLPVSSVRELVAYAKANPGKLNFGVPTTGSSGHLQAEFFKQLTGTQITSVMYQGGGPGQIALMSGEVQLYFMPVAATIPFIKQGKMKLIAAVSRQRLPYFPDVPTLEESGYNGFDDLANWQGLLGPARLPRAIVDRLYSEMARVLRLPEVRERLAAVGSDPIGSTPEEFAAQIKREIPHLGNVIKAAGMKPE